MLRGVCKLVTGIELVRCGLVMSHIFMTWWQTSNLLHRLVLTGPAYRSNRLHTVCNHFVVHEGGICMVRVHRLARVVGWLVAVVMVLAPLVVVKAQETT